MKRKRNIIPPEIVSAANYTAASAMVGKAAKYLGKKVKKFKKNPATQEDAAELSEKWHGRDARESVEVEEIENYDEDLAELADLEELGIITPDLSCFSIKFNKDRPKVCAVDEHNIEFVGGDQKIDVEATGVEREGKRLIPLGYIYQIVYETDKHHLEGSNGYPEPYEHYFCEEYYKEVCNPDDFKNSDDWFDYLMDDGIVSECMEKLPMLIYNKTDKKLVVVGGVYTVEDVGIKN